MGEEFQTGICGGNYWWINNINSATRSVFPLMMSSSPCSVVANNDAGGISYSTWQTDAVDLKTTTTTSCSDNNDNMVSDVSLGFLDLAKPLLQHHQANEAAADSAGNHNGSILMDSTLQMMGLGLSSNWNHSLFSRGMDNSMLQEGTGIDSRGDSSQSQDQKREISMKNQHLCGGFSDGSSVSSSYGYPSSSSTLIQSLYDIPQPQPQAHSLFTNPPSSMAYSSSTPNYGAMSSTEIPTPTITSSSWSKTYNSLLKSSGLHFSNSTPFWNASVEAPLDKRAGVSAPYSQAQEYQTSLISEKTNFPSSLISKPKREEATDLGKKSSCEPAIKRQRIETPSPLPTFKVRKEKLGDRITALQQLVSPFGKTDTASVLHEAIECIKFLHDQVSVLSTPYMKNAHPVQHCQQDTEAPEQDLRIRGLCLVPISSTFPVTSETTVDFWTPSFGGTLIR